MYESNGDFGKTRITDARLTENDINTLFCYTRIFWHSVNDLYAIDRPDGTDNFLVLITLDGNAVLKTKNSVHSLTRGHIAIIPPNTAHNYSCCPGYSWTFYGIHIVANFSSDILMRIIQENGICYVHEGTQTIADSLEHIMFKSRSSSYNMTHTISKLVSDFIHELFTDNKDAKTIKKSETLFEKAVEYIELNFASAIDVDELSTRFFTSTSHFIRVFKECSGVTPYQYIENYRMIQARQLLCHTRLSVADIARKVGYKNTSNFIAYFKKHKGVTPGVYRKNLDKYEKLNDVTQPFFTKNGVVGNSKYKIR